MPGIIDLGRVVGDAGPGVPAGGRKGQVLVKASGDDYDGEWETRPKTVNGVEADEDGDIKIKKVQFADNLESDDAQQSMGVYALRTTGGDASLSDGDAWLVRVLGRRVHTGYVPESLTMTVTPAQREGGEYAITAELDEATFKAYVASSGTITLTYDEDDGWSANPATYGVTVTGTPIDGDEIEIVYVKEVRGTITQSNPTSFASTGWNLYDHTNGYARVLKYSDTRGFLVGGNYTLLQYSETLTGTKTEITVTGGAFTIPGDGYVWVTGGDATTTYILMTWSDWTSGYDGDWKAYSESVVNLATIMSSYFPYGLMQVGGTYDVIDLSMKQTISNIERMAYSASNLSYAEQSGRGYEYDENYIYLVREEPVVNAITIDGKHTACDHGMEIVKGTGVAVQVETLYGENLKDKLQHDIPNTLAAQAAAIVKQNTATNKSVCPIITGSTNDSGVAIASGEYFCVNDGTNDGLYLATAAIGTGVAWSGKGTLQSAHGGLNALNSKITQFKTKTVTAVFNNSQYSENISIADIDSSLANTNFISAFCVSTGTGLLVERNVVKTNISFFSPDSALNTNRTVTIMWTI